MGTSGARGGKLGITLIWKPRASDAEVGNQRERQKRYGCNEELSCQGGTVQSIYFTKSRSKLFLERITTNKGGWKKRGSKKSARKKKWWSFTLMKAGADRGTATFKKTSGLQRWRLSMGQCSKQQSGRGWSKEGNSTQGGGQREKNRGKLKIK